MDGNPRHGAAGGFHDYRTGAARPRAELAGKPAVQTRPRRRALPAAGFRLLYACTVTGARTMADDLTPASAKSSTSSATTSRCSTCRRRAPKSPVPSVSPRPTPPRTTCARWRRRAITLEPGSARGIRLVEQLGLPLIGTVAAGSPLLAVENRLGNIRIDPALFTPRADFSSRARPVHDRGGDTRRRPARRASHHRGQQRLDRRRPHRRRGHGQALQTARHHGRADRREPRLRAILVNTRKGPLAIEGRRRRPHPRRPRALSRPRAPFALSP